MSATVKAMKVELRGFNDDGKVIVEGTITLEDDKLVGDTYLANEILKDSFYDPNRRQFLTSENGQAFLEALHVNISGSRLWATKPE